MNNKISIKKPLINKDIKGKPVVKKIVPKINPISVENKTDEIVKTVEEETDVSNIPVQVTEKEISISLEEKLNDLEANIKNMDTISGLKEHVIVHHELTNTLNEYKKSLDTYRDSIKFICTYTHEDINDKEFSSITTELVKLRELFANERDIEKLIELYKDAKGKIEQCDNYLLKQKMDIVIV
jgi:hypothetical protein